MSKIQVNCPECDKPNFFDLGVKSKLCGNCGHKVFLTAEQIVELLNAPAFEYYYARTKCESEGVIADVMMSFNFHPLHMKYGEIAKRLSFDSVIVISWEKIPEEIFVNLNDFAKFVTDGKGKIDLYLDGELFEVNSKHEG